MLRGATNGYRVHFKLKDSFRRADKINATDLNGRAQMRTPEMDTMGTSALIDPALTASTRLPYAYSTETSTSRDKSPTATTGTAGKDAEDGVYPNRQQAVEQAYTSAVYQRETFSLSLSARFQEVAARFSDAHDGATDQVSGQQLAFDFHTESTYEQLALFQERTSRVADGLEGTQRETFSEVSQTIASRFEFSLSLSATSLQGFAGAAEGSASLNELFGQLLDYTQQLLDQADSLFSSFFEGFAGFDFTGMQDAFRARMEEALAGFLGAGQGSQAQLTSGDGTTVSATNVQFEFSFSFSFSASATVQTAAVQESDPIILDLDGDGFELSSYQNGADFDILGNGGKQNTAFVTGGDAFLALDRNGDGVINSGKELFGDQNGASNGYEELRKLDDNGDGVIDRQDKQFGELRLFRDNGNGLTEDGELITLAQAGIESLSLRYADVNQRAAGGNRMAQLASFRRTDGTLGRAGDAVLNYTA